MELIRQSPDVFLAKAPIVVIDQENVAMLKAAAATSTRGRVRINMHPDGGDPLHEMFIAIQPDSYIRPHKHPAKSESFHIIYGVVDIVVFEDDGAIREVVKLGDAQSGRAFYYRMSKPFFHTLLIRSDILVVHEITNGPFRPEGTVFADFAPEEGDEDEIAVFQTRLLHQLLA